jgi:hypothetical protein
MRILRAFPLRARKRRDPRSGHARSIRWAASQYDVNAGRAFHALMARDAAALHQVGVM